jgi:hypothetical protein
MMEMAEAEDRVVLTAGSAGVAVDGVRRSLLISRPVIKVVAFVVQINTECSCVWMGVGGELDMELNLFYYCVDH